MFQLFGVSTILLSIVLFLWPLSHGARPGHPIIYLAEMKQCPGKNNLPVMGVNFTVARINRTRRVLSGDIVFKEPFPKGFKGNRQ